MTELIYIHGFNSSPQGTKGQQVKEAMLERGLIRSLRAPKLAVEPLKAIAELEELVEASGKPMLIGSSLGGYYATYLAEKYQLKALLINPAVLPHKLLGKKYDEQIDYHDNSLSAIDTIEQMLIEAYDNKDQSFLNSYIKELASLEVSAPTDKARYKVWLKTGDEVIDYRFAKDWYKACDLRVDEGGDHGFADFANYIPDILEWANLSA